MFSCEAAILESKAKFLYKVKNYMLYIVILLRLIPFNYIKGSDHDNVALLHVRKISDLQLKVESKSCDESKSNLFMYIRSPNSNSIDKGANYY